MMQRLCLFVTAIACVALCSSCGAIDNQTEAPLSQTTQAESPNDLVFEMRTETFETKMQDGTVFLTHEVTYPFFFGDSTVAQIINADYAQRIQEYSNPDMEEMENWYANTIEAEAASHLPYYENIDAEVTFNQDGYVSILNVVLDWSGGGHPYHYENGVTYDIKTAEEITSSAEFLQGNMQNIRESLSYCFEVAAETSTEEWQIDSMLRDTPFVLKESGLCYYFNVGDAVPRVEVVIPFTKAHSVMISCDAIAEKIAQNDTKSEMSTTIVTTTKLATPETTKTVYSKGAYFQYSLPPEIRDQLVIEGDGTDGVSFYEASNHATDGNRGWIVFITTKDADEWEENEYPAYDVLFQITKGNETRVVYALYPTDCQYVYGDETYESAYYAVYDHVQDILDGVSPAEGWVIQ